MRQFFVRLILLVLVVLLIFGLYRLLTIRPLGNVAFFTNHPRLAAVHLPPVDAAQAAGANGLILPVTLMEDGVLVVTDAPTRRTLAEVLAQYATLRAVVRTEDPSLQVVAALLQAIDTAQARDRVLVEVDDALLARTLRQQAPNLATISTRAETNAFLTMQRLRLTPFYRPSAPGMLLPAADVTPRLLHAAHSRGIHVIALADGSDVTAVQALLDAGVDGVALSDTAQLSALHWPGN